MAAGKFNNSLLMNFFANGSGLDTINTTGGGSSNVVLRGHGLHQQDDLQHRRR